MQPKSVGGYQQKYLRQNLTRACAIPFLAPPTWPFFPSRRPSTVVHSDHCPQRDPNRFTNWTCLLSTGQLQKLPNTSTRSRNTQSTIAPKMKRVWQILGLKLSTGNKREAKKCAQSLSNQFSLKAVTTNCRVTLDRQCAT